MSALIVRFDSCSHQLGKPFDNRQAKPRAADRVPVAAKEALEDLAFGACGQAGAIIRHSEGNAAIGHARSKANLSAVCLARAVDDGVLYQIEQCLMQ